MSAIDEISEQLFTVFRDRVLAPEQWKSPVKRLKPADIDGALDKLYGKARELRHTHRPGVVARARIILALQRRFHAAGYSAEMTREVLFSLILTAFVGKP